MLKNIVKSIIHLLISRQTVRQTGIHSYVHMYILMTKFVPTSVSYLLSEIPTLPRINVVPSNADF